MGTFIALKSCKGWFKNCKTTLIYSICGFLRRHDIQYNDTKHKDNQQDTQHIGLICDIHHK
jgi:hypothetical protein